MMVNKGEFVDYFDMLNKDGIIKGNTNTQCLMELCERARALEAEVEKLKLKAG